jgi:hypothetical protein
VLRRAWVYPHDESRRGSCAFLWVVEGGRGVEVGCVPL